MPFIALNGTTYRLQSNGMGQKYNEHGTDRFRTFDGAMRVTRRGIYREWNGNTAILSYDDAAALIAVLTSPIVPLALTGDLVGVETVSVMPVLVSNDPINTASGPKRRVVFTLHETPTTLPPDTSAMPWAFLRRATGFFADDAATVAALDGDQIAVWEDQTGNSRNFTQDGGLFVNTAVRPLRDGESVKFGHGSSPQSWLNSPSVAAMTHIELLVSIKADNDPAIDAAQNQPGWGGGYTIYPSTDSHIYDGLFGSGSIDWGDPLEDLTEWNVVDIYSSATAGYAGRLNNVVKVTAVNGVGFTYGNPSAFQIGNSSGGGFFKGHVRDVVMFDGILTTTQRVSWYNYLSGAVEDPPL